MKVRDIPGTVRDQIILADSVRADKWNALFKKAGDTELPPGVVEWLRGKDLLEPATPAQDLLTGENTEMDKELGYEDLTPVTDRSVLDDKDFLTPGGTAEQQAAKSKGSAKAVEAPKDLEGIRQMKAEATYRTINEPEGLIRYSFRVVDSDTGQLVKAQDFRRKEPLSQAAIQEIKDTWKLDFNDTEVEIDKSIVPASADKYREALRDRQQSAGALLGEDYLEDLQQFQAFSPGMAQRLFLGEETNPLKSPGAALTMLGDAATLIPRKLVADFVDENDADFMARTSPNPESGFLSQLAQSAAQDPTLPASILAGGGLLSSLKSAPLKTMMGEAAIGAVEGMGDLAYRRAAGTTAEGDESMAQAGLISGGGATLGSLALGGLKNYRKQAANKPLGTLARKISEFKEGVARGLGDAEGIGRAEASRKIRRQSGAAGYDVEQANTIASDLGKAPADLFPGLALANRNSLEGDDIVKLANANPEVFNEWEQAYEEVVDLIDKQTNFKTALDPDAAGQRMFEDARVAKNSIFEEANTTYRAVVQDPTISAAIGSAIQRKLPKVIDRVEDALAEIESRQAKVTTTQDKEIVGLVDEFGQPLKKQEQKLENLKGTSIEAESELSDSANRVKALRKNLGILKSAEDPKEVAKALNNLRANAQLDLTTPTPFGVPDRRNLSQKEIRDITQQALMESIEEVSPTYATSLKESNDLIKKYSELEARIGDVFNKEGKLDGTQLFNQVTKDVKKMEAFRDLITNRIQVDGEGDAFKPYMDAYAKDKLVKFATTGEVADKQANILRPNSREANFYQQFNAEVDFNKLKTYADALYKLSSPLRQGLGQAIKSLPKDMSLGKMVSSPKAMAGSLLDMMRGPDYSRMTPEEVRNYREMWAQLKANQMNAFGDLGRSETGAELLGERIAVPVRQGLGALRSLAMFEGENLFAPMQEQPTPPPSGVSAYSSRMKQLKELGR